jgi:hypothetical protein
MITRSMAKIWVIVGMTVLGVACGSSSTGGSSSGSSGGSSSGSSSGGPTGSCMPQAAQGSCYLANGSNCSEYNGSEFGSLLSSLGQQCTQAGGTFTMGGCPTNNRLPGECVLNCGKSTESVAVLYTGAGMDTQSFCTARGAVGTYLP